MRGPLRFRNLPWLEPMEFLELLGPRVRPFDDDAFERRQAITKVINETLRELERAGDRDRVHDYRLGLGPAVTEVQLLTKKLEETAFELANKGRWVVAGRRAPHLPSEFVPVRALEFLEFRWEEGTAMGEDLSYRQLKFLLLAGVPDTHPIHREARRAFEEPRITDRTGCGPSVPAVGPQGGRPSVMPTILAEHDRRAAAGEAASAQAEEARALAAWFRARHPDAPAPAVETIARRLRERRRSN